MKQPTLTLAMPGDRLAVFRYGADNGKLGRAVQVYILAEGADPNNYGPAEEARVCGACPLQSWKGGGCYVLRWQGPRHAARAATDPLPWEGPVLAAAAVREWAERHVPKGVLLRWGAYGDPGFLPWDWLCDVSQGWRGQVIGYTRTWTHNPTSPARRWLRASTLTAAEAASAESLGWRSYLITDAPPADSWACPSVDGATCETCGACGISAGAPQTITIAPHGARAARVREAIRNLERAERC
jgi:hypothetical protein